jgi:hypothetical protein
MFEEFERQLAFAPPEALRRQMEAAERLAHEVDPAATYPFEFVQWRLTGFRAKDAALAAIGGDALRGDLSTFVLHLSERLTLSHDERQGGAIAIRELAGELGVTEKTLRRWRERGLIAHRIMLADGRSRVGVYRDEWQRFVTSNAALIDEARTFTRMDEATEARVLDEVRALVEAGQTPNLAAKKVARAIGRSHETIRQLLLRTPGELTPGRRAIGSRQRTHDRSTRERRLAYRAWRFGVPLERIALAGETKVDAVRRRIDSVRAERLRSIRLTWIEFPTFDRPDARETILGSESVRQDLRPTCDPHDVLAMVRALAAERSTGPRVESIDEAMLAAYNFLKRGAKQAIGTLERSPDRRALDRIETDLRWALRLQRRLVERLLPGAILRVEQSLNGSLPRRPVEEVRSLVVRCVAIVAEVIESVDPSKRQSARRLVALDTDRMLAQHAASLRSTRAAVRHEPGALAIPELFECVVPWSGIVEVLSRGASQSTALPPPQRELLARRYGWDGRPPATLEELASAGRTTVARMTAQLIAAERQLRQLRRSVSSGGHV